MNEVKVSKDELLKTLKANKESHVQIYNDALEGVRVEYKKLLQKEMDKLDAGKEVKSSVSVSMPRNHEEEYEEVIQMLEMSVETEITLSRHEFKNYVQDQWVSQSEKDLLRHFALSSSNSAMYA